MIVVKRCPNGEMTLHWERNYPDHRKNWYERGEWHAMCVKRFFVAVYDYAEGFLCYPYREFRRRNLPQT